MWWIWFSSSLLAWRFLLISTTCFDLVGRNMSPSHIYLCVWKEYCVRDWRIVFWLHKDIVCLLQADTTFVYCRQTLRLFTAGRHYVCNYYFREWYTSKASFVCCDVWNTTPLYSAVQRSTTRANSSVHGVGLSTSHYSWQAAPLSMWLGGGPRHGSHLSRTVHTQSRRQQYAVTRHRGARNTHWPGHTLCVPRNISWVIKWRRMRRAGRVWDM